MKTIKLLMIKLLNEWKFIYWTKVGFKNNGLNGLKLFFSIGKYNLRNSD